MFFIDSVEINGMWGRKDLAVSFHKNINIFIGKNGSGKTTYASMLKDYYKETVVTGAYHPVTFEEGHGNHPNASV